MKYYQIKIETLSDLCVSDGGILNSFVDIDICYDDLGFPYIPAKRLKGCLRECAVELNDWGRKIPIEKIFGGKGSADRGAVLRLDNARLEDFQKMRESVRSGHILFHPQNVLRHFSYVRTQTGIDYETGVARDTSLRTIRVAKKGLVFYADMQLPEKYKKDIEECCGILRHMGIARTRGMGQVRVTVHDMYEDSDAQQDGMTRDSDAFQKVKRIPWHEGAVKLYYRIRLQEPMICKSVAGGEAKSLDYIHGSQVLGLLLSVCKKQHKEKELLEMFLDGDILEKTNPENGGLKKVKLYCSNAYVEVGGQRGMEVPAYFSAVKNKKRNYVNSLIPKTDELRKEQIQPMKHCYVARKGKQVVCKKVSLVERYHHRRPEDKSIGRAAEEAGGDSMFYQISSIEDGQNFQGYIQGTPRQVAAVYQLLGKTNTYFMGYSNRMEYGKVQFEIIGLQQEQVQSMVKGRYLLVNLLSPAVVYNQKAFYSTDINDLLEEIYISLGITEEDVASPQKFIKYTTLGGYNVTWNRRKPIIQAFDKGTAVFLPLEKEMDFPVFQTILIGERHQEGYGEILVQCLEKIEDYLPGQGKILEEEAGENSCVVSNPQGFVLELCDDLYEQFVMVYATKEAKNKNGSYDGDKIKPTISNMLLMCKDEDCQSMDLVAQRVARRYEKASEEKKKKKQIADQILADAKKGYESLAIKFAEKYQVSGFVSNREDMEQIYLSAYLTQLKYMLREKEKKERQEEISHE